MDIKNNLNEKSSGRGNKAERENSKGRIEEGRNGMTEREDGKRRKGGGKQVGER